MDRKPEAAAVRSSRTEYLCAKFFGEIESQSVIEIYGLFHLLDADASGELEVGEFISSAASLGFEGSQAELAAQLQEFGKSGDDVLTDEEFIRFVGNLINKEKPELGSASPSALSEFDSTITGTTEVCHSRSMGTIIPQQPRMVTIDGSASEHSQLTLTTTVKRASAESSEEFRASKKNKKTVFSSGTEVEGSIRRLEFVNKELIKQKEKLAEEKLHLRSEVERLNAQVLDLADQLDNQGGKLDASIEHARLMAVEAEARKKSFAKQLSAVNIEDCFDGKNSYHESQEAAELSQSLADARAKIAHLENLCSVTGASLERANEEKLVLEQRSAGYKFKFAIQTSLMAKKYHKALLERTEAEAANEDRIKQLFGLDRSATQSLDMTDPTDVMKFERSLMAEQMLDMNARLRKAHGRIYSLEMCALKMHAPDVDVAEIKDRFANHGAMDIPLSAERTPGSRSTNQQTPTSKCLRRSLSPRQSAATNRQVVDSVRRSAADGGANNTALLMETLEELEKVIGEKENVEHEALELQMQLQRYKEKCEELEAESHNAERAESERRRNSQMQRDEMEEELRALREKLAEAAHPLPVEKEATPNERGLADKVGAADNLLAELEEKLKLTQFECGKLERAAAVNEAYAKKEADWLTQEKEKAIEELEALKNTFREKETQLQQMVDDLRVETKRLQLQLQESEMQISEINQNAKQAAQFSEATVTRLQGELDEAKGQKNALDSDMENAKQKALDQVRELRSEQVNYESTIERLTKRNKQLDELLSDEKTRSVHVKEKLAVEIAALEQKLLLAKKEKDDVENEVSELKQSRTDDARRFVATEDALKENIARLLEDKKQADQELASAKARANRQSQDLNTEVDDALKKCDGLRKENAQLAQELSSNKRLVTDIQTKLDNARSDLQRSLAREKQRIMDHEEQASMHELRLAQLNLEMRELRRDLTVSERDVDKWRNFHLENSRRMEMLNEGMIRQQKTTAMLKSHM